MLNKYTVTGVLVLLIMALFWYRLSNSTLKQVQTLPTKNTSNLTDFQKQVLYQKATEPPFKNEYWDEHRTGIYVAADTGEPLFSSSDKFDSGTGWPSFTKPINPKAIKTQTDYELGFARTEVTTVSGAHLGHVFADGPKEFGGLRYCINSAALKFIPSNKK